MKWAIFFLLIVSNSWAKSLVLVSYFDAFGKAPFNNSDRVAHQLENRFKDHPHVDFRLCALSTVFDKSFAQMETCLKELPAKPDLVLGLGEFNCRLKIEIMGRNVDKTNGPDNEGNERKDTPVVAGGPEAEPLTYPLAAMYCALDQKVRNNLEVSNSAGTFVCNNLAYQVAHFYPELTFGFIHVPANNCRGLEAKTAEAVDSLQKMLISALQVNETRPLPIYRDAIKEAREASRRNKCEYEFYKRTKGFEEKGIWPF